MRRKIKQTSHTCSLVSSEFQRGIVFPAGACFSRLKDDDVCHCTATRSAASSTCNVDVIISTCNLLFLTDRETPHLLLPLTSSVADDSIRDESIESRRLTTKQYQFHLLISEPWEQG